MNDTPTTIEERIDARIDKGVTNALTVSSSGGGVSFETAVQAMEFAKMMAISGISIPKHLRGNPGACLAIVIQAVEWRLSPFAVANKSYSVNDRMAYESQLIQAVILQRAPIVGRFKVEYTGEGANRRCRVWAILKDTKEEVDYTSPPVGQIPVKNSPLWKGDTDQQLYYYSARALCRRHFPDVILGVYAREELEERDPEDARDITPARPSLGDKLDALANPEAQKAEAAKETAAKEKKVRKAIIEERKTSAKAGEAAVADDGNKAGAPSPQAQATASTDSAPVSEQQTAAAEHPPAEAKSADAAESSPAASAATPKPMTEAHRTGMRRMHADMMQAMSNRKVKAAFDYFVEANELTEADAAYDKAWSVLVAHMARISGDGSPSNCDAALNKAISQG